MRIPKSTEAKINKLKEEIAATRFYLGMAEHGLKGYFPHPGHEEEAKRLSKKLVDLLIELAKLGAHE